MAGVRKRLGSFLGPDGRSATIESVTAESVPATEQSSVVVGGDNLHRTLHLKLQQGMPAAEAVPQDAGVAGFVASPGSETHQAVGAHPAIVDLARGGGLMKSAVVAAGSGGADQAAQINAELSSLSTFGGGTLEVRGGLHDNLSTITVPAYCTLRGVGWSVTAQDKGTVLRFAAGQDGVILAGQASRIEGLSVISKEASVGTSVGVTIDHLHCTMRDVNVGMFGSHGIKCDSTGGGPRNEARIDNVRSYQNGGSGLFIDGGDSNAGWVTALDLTANQGAAQLFNEGSRWIIEAHIDTAGINATTEAVWDNAISNDYNVYVEASAGPGSNFHMGSLSTYGVLDALTYAKPKIVADNPAAAFTSWRVYEKSGWRRVEIQDTYTGADGGAAAWVMDSGIAGANRFRLGKVGGGGVFEIDGSLAWSLFRTPVRMATYTTATRPGSASAGVGAQIYDTTLGKPLWSNGSAWRDASGTAV